MTDLHQWKCDVCGTVYADKNTCERCEKEHIAVSKIKSSRYQSFTNGGRYPDKISVEFKDESTRTYKLISE